MKKTIHPCLWFNGNAKEAATLYCSVFKNSMITSENPMVVMWELNGQKFMGLNGGPQFTINPSISFFAMCETVDETENAWSLLLEGGEVLMPLSKYPWSEKYGWLQDRFGVSWQIAHGSIKDVGQQFSPCLLFGGSRHGRAEEALKFYTSIFDKSTVDGIMKYGPGQEDPEGTVQHAQFRLSGYTMMVMDSASSNESFNEGVSFVISCDNQEEIDYFWNKLTAGGQESMCGWLVDKFGVSWQVVPSKLGKWMNDPGAGKQVVDAFLKMKKFDIAELESKLKTSRQRS